VNKIFFLYFRLVIVLSLCCFQNAFGITSIELPIDCKLGENCWIANLPRHFYQGKELDYKCGFKTSSGHKGTDFILESMEQMKQGIDILAPFDGVVKAVRDGIEDINVDIGGLDKIKDQECGNGLVIATHDLEAQLCHMKKGSISVKVGDQVLAGERLGSVGLSGNTNHPKLYFALSKKNQDGSLSEIDPFYGDQANCGLRPQPLWANPDYLSENVKEGIVYNYGIAFQIPELAKVREGYYQRIIQPRNPEVIMVFADVLSVDKGHKMKVQFLDPEEKILFEKEQEFTKYQPRYFFYVGKNLHREQIHGNFAIKITYTKPDESVVTYSKEVVLE